MKNDSSASIEEARLRNELLRIRNTYSFRLGLLLTEAFFRRPWLIPLLPFQFIKMNFDFWRSRSAVSKSLTHASFGSNNPECLLIFVASEGGRAACERAKELADEWLSEYRHHLVIVSSNSGLIGINQPNLSLYMIPDPKSKRDISRSEWNKSCENVMYRAIYTHLPSTFIFDGPYPYRGVLNAISSATDMKSIWIQSERTNQEVIAKSSSHFTEMRVINYLENPQLAPSNNKRTYHSLTNKVLVATGYGIHEELQKTPTLILKILSGYERLDLIGVKNSVDPPPSAQFTEYWGEVMSNPEMNSLQAAIVSDNIDLISKLHSLMIPTLCILHQNTTPDVHKLIQSLAQSGTLFVTQENEKEEIELYIQALINREWNLSITHRGTLSPKSTLLQDLIQQ